MTYESRTIVAATATILLGVSGDTVHAVTQDVVILALNSVDFGNPL